MCSWCRHQQKCRSRHEQILVADMVNAARATTEQWRQCLRRRKHGGRQMYQRRHHYQHQQHVLIQTMGPPTGSETHVRSTLTILKTHLSVSVWTLTMTMMTSARQCAASVQRSVLKQR